MFSSYMTWAKTRPEPHIDLAGSNMLACPIDELPGAREAVALTGRNDDGYAPLVEAIAARYGVASDAVATATGCSGANFVALASVLSAGDDVLVERPAYDPLIGAARLLGTRVVRFDRRFEQGYALDPDRVAAAMTPRTRAIVVTSPHNPSGVLAGDDAIAAVGRLAAGAGAILLVDEVYSDVVRGCGAPPAVRLGASIVTTNSLTKSYGLSPLRCGWTISSPARAERIRRARDVVDAAGSLVSDLMARVAFDRLAALHARTRRVLDANREHARTLIQSRPELACVLGPGPVLFPRLEGTDDATPFVERLAARHGIAVVPGHFFESAAHFRIGLGGPPDRVAEGLAAIGAALDER